MICPQASYLVFLDVCGLGMPHDMMVEFFIREAKVGVNDGAIFGQGGEGFMRMNFCCNIDGVFHHYLLGDSKQKIREKLIKRLHQK